MSEAKPAKRELKELKELLKKRGLTIADIRKQTFSGHSHLHQVLQGSRKGPSTWKRLLSVLDGAELRCAMARANDGLAALSDETSEGYHVELVEEEGVAAGIAVKALKPKSST